MEPTLEAQKSISTDNAIVVKGLRKSFKKLTVLDGIDLCVKRGTVLALLGPNGAGKTTTIRILSTLLLPDGGQALIHGFDVVREANKVRSLIGLTGQYAAVDEYLTGASGRTVKTYSGGMRRRLDLAVSLIAAPPIIFLDEPTTGLDPRSRLIMWDIIEQLVAAGTTILLTTQDMDEADRLADKIVVIDGGRIIAEGTSNELKQRVGSERLEITIAEASSFETAKRVFDGGDESLHLDIKARTLSLAATKGNGVHQVKEVLSRLDEAGIGVENISFRRPTLDDVFLTLTGHTTTTDQSNELREKKSSGGLNT